MEIRKNIFLFQAAFIVRLALLAVGSSSTAPDENGYIVYCPCMGRFGNQADHFLGSLGFAQHLNRTLVLPPWVEYRRGELRSRQVAFDKYFKVSSLEKFHRVVPMAQFMESIAPTIWPPSRRISFCYMERKSFSGDDDVLSCNAKEGNPFGPFWDEFTIDFVGSEFFGPLNYDVHHSKMAEKWNLRFPADEWPVIAFTGAPASFPVQLENRELHKFLEWSDEIQTAANNFVKNVIPKGAFIGIHLRNGVDWTRACEHIKSSPNLFSAAQCLGYRNERGNVTMDMCLPSRDVIVRQLKRHIRAVKEQGRHNVIRSVFVASDSNHMINDLTDSLQRMKVSVLRWADPPSPHVDLAILAKANHFFGNCVSSFSAFVKRERDVRGFSSSFWGFPTEKSQTTGHRRRAGSLGDNSEHEEL